MFAPKLSFLLVAALSSSLFSTSALAAHLKGKANAETVDINAMELLIKRYPLSGIPIPQALIKSIGHCKFMSNEYLGNVLLNGTSTAYDLRLGTSKANDTCLYFGN